MSPNTHDNLSASLEDYLEAIYHLSAEDRAARSKDIAQRLKVSRASVTGALRSLSSKGLVHYQPYGGIRLTEKGRQLAGRVARKHAILTRFFADVLGVDAALSHEAACRAEHSLCPEITPRLTAFVDFITQTQGDETTIVQQFQQHWKSISENEKGGR